jgi:outer membrane receptor protein involved in Fe transport
MNERNYEDRFQTRGSLNWYKPDWFNGNHEIKVGGDFFKIRADRHRLTRPAGSGNYQLIFRSGAADQISVFNTPVHPDAPLRTFGAFVQDSWTIARKLTLNVGARYNYENGSKIGKPGTIAPICGSTTPAALPRSGLTRGRIRC